MRAIVISNFRANGIRGCKGDMLGQAELDQLAGCLDYLVAEGCLKLQELDSSAEQGSQGDPKASVPNEDTSEALSGESVPSVKPTPEIRSKRSKKGKA